MTAPAIPAGTTGSISLPGGITLPGGIPLPTGWEPPDFTSGTLDQSTLDWGQFDWDSFTDPTQLGLIDWGSVDWLDIALTDPAQLADIDWGFVDWSDMVDLAEDAWQAIDWGSVDWLDIANTDPGQFADIEWGSIEWEEMADLAEDVWQAIDWGEINWLDFTPDSYEGLIVDQVDWTELANSAWDSFDMQSIDFDQVDWAALDFEGNVDYSTLTDILDIDFSADGDEGNDRAFGGQAGDVARMGKGFDFFDGGLGDDTAEGGAGIDNLLGGLGGDRLDGGADGDILEGGDGNDVLAGGEGIDEAVFEGDADDYGFVLKADGSVEVAGADGTDLLSGIEGLEFGGSEAPLTELLPDVQLDCARHAAKVQTYFLGVLGREATTQELDQFTSTLQSNQGRVWWNADISGLSGTDSLMGYLMSQPEYAGLNSGLDDAAAIDAVFGRLTGQDAPDELVDHYLGRLDAGTLQGQGLVNKMIGDLWLSPKGDGTLGSPSGFLDNRGWLNGEAYMGYLNRLDGADGVEIANLDAGGNLVDLVGTQL